MQVVDEGTVWLALRVALAPAAMRPMAQVKAGPPEQLPWEAMTVAWLKPAGQVSSTRRLRHSLGSAEWSSVVCAYVLPSPAVTAVTPSDLVMLRSALVSTVSVSL